MKKTVDSLTHEVYNELNLVKGASAMAESEAHKKWTKENTVFIGLKLQKSTDADILAFLDGKPNQPTIKKALREYIANHEEEKL